MAIAAGIDLHVLAILDEVQKPGKKHIGVSLHPSELKNKKYQNRSQILVQKFGRVLADLFEIINDYHAYCKACKQHFYTQSKPNDVNSYFQNHLNSVDHRTNSTVNPCDEKKPIIEWEKWLYTGCCNICNLEGINAYIKHFNVPLTEIVDKHIKGYRHQHKAVDFNNDLPRHVQLAKKLSNTELYSKFLKNINNVNVCLLCSKRLKGKEIVVKNHLNSEGHVNELLKFIEKKYSYSPEELLNGFNLEDLLRKSLSDDFVMELNEDAVESEVDDDYLSDTDYESESERKNYEGLGSEFNGFSPKQIEELLKIHDSDFVSRDLCTLCNEVHQNMEEHLSSNSHKLRVLVFQQCGQAQVTEHHAYLKNRADRLKAHDKDIRKYNELKKILEEKNLTYGIPYKTEFDELKLELPEIKSEIIENDKNGDSNDLLSRYISVKGDTYTCTLCNIKTYTQNAAKAHLIGKKHLSMIEDAEKQNDTLQGHREFIRNIVRDKFSTDEDCIKKDVRDNLSTCMVCKQSFITSKATEHLLGQRHQATVEHYMALQELIKDPKFIDPIQCWSKKEWVCMICNILTHEKSLDSHIVGRTHFNNYERYKSVRNEPLTLDFFHVTQNDVVCKNCGNKIYSQVRRVPKSQKISGMLSAMKSHYLSFCFDIKTEIINANHQLVNGGSPSNLSNKLEDIFKVNQSVVAKNKNIARAKPMSIPCEKCGVPYKQEEIEAHTAQCSRIPGIDLVMMQSKIQEIFNLFQNDMVRNVNQKLHLRDTSETSSDRSRTCSESTPISSRNCSESSESPTSMQNTSNNVKVPGNKEKPRGGGKMKIDRRDSTIDTYFCTACRKEGPIELYEDHIDSNEHYAKEKIALSYGPIRERTCHTCSLQMIGNPKIMRDHFKTRVHLENQDVEMQKKMDAKLNDMNTVDVLVVSDLPKTGNKYEALLVLFKQFGTIKHIKLDKVKAVLEFIEPGAIQRALKSQPIVMFNKPLTLTCAKEKGTPKYFLHEEMIKLLSDPELLMEHAFKLVEIANKVMESQVERDRENRVYNTLCKALANVYPYSRCYPFGSRYSGLILDNSDFDIFLDCENLYSGLTKQEPRYQEDIVHNVARALRKNPECIEINAVPRARVPIISFLHKPTNLHCDVSFKNGLSCQNTKLIKFMVSFDPRVKPFILFLKDWIDLNQLHGPPLFSSYAVTMLVIYYLEQLEHPVLPTVELLQQLYVGPRTTIGGWDCSFCTNLSIIPKTVNYDSLPELILGFFEFYANFRYSEYIISPLTGKPLLRSSIENMAREGLPMPYKRQMYNIPLENFARRTYPICIMDPFDLSHNLTKSFPKFGLELFIYFCEASAKLLQTALDKKNRYQS